MPRGLFVDQPQHVILAEYQDAPLREHEVRFRTEFAAIKHGTIFHLFSGESPFQDQRFDRDLRLFVKKETPDQQPGGMVGQFVGNMSVGRVEATGSAVEQFQPGDRVYCYGPIAETVTKAAAEVHPLPAAVSPAEAVCLDPALYAYAAVRDGRIGLGDNVVVTGMGAIGLFVVQLLARSGCLNVIAVDPMPKRRALAERLGAHHTIDPSQTDTGLEVRRLLGQGADVAIEASGNYRALYDAMRSVQQCARIVTLGYYKGDHSHVPFGAEWHHNRLELISSMPVWNNPSREHPLWDLARLEQTVLEFFVRGWLTAGDIVTPIVDFEDAAEAFLSVYHDPTDAVKLTVRFPG
jgi:threonine dehydrogenase-like Zn-dependent dehydrogenase